MKKTLFILAFLFCTPTPSHTQNTSSFVKHFAKGLGITLPLVLSNLIAKKLISFYIYKINVHKDTIEIKNCFDQGYILATNTPLKIGKGEEEGVSRVYEVVYPANPELNLSYGKGNSFFKDEGESILFEFKNVGPFVMMSNKKDEKTTYCGMLTDSDLYSWQYERECINLFNSSPLLAKKLGINKKIEDYGRLPKEFICIFAKVCLSNEVD